MGSYDIGQYVFFFFRETAVEYINCGKSIFSRVARVCKKDMGGKNILNYNWVTYLKARLNCSIPGEYPFYFNEIRKCSRRVQSPNRINLERFFAPQKASTKCRVTIRSSTAFSPLPPRVWWDRPYARSGLKTSITRSLAVSRSKPAPPLLGFPSCPPKYRNQGLASVSTTLKLCQVT